MAYTKKELSQMDSDHDYWDEFVDAIGWKLIGWTGRSNALIDTGRKNVYLPSFSITGDERDAIMLAINKAKGEK